MPRWADEETAYLARTYPTAPRSEITTRLDRSWTAIKDKAAREDISRHPQISLISSVRSAPEPHFPDARFNNYIVGLVDGEGTFCTDGSSGHQFAIELIADDGGILRDIQQYLSVGRIGEYDRHSNAQSSTVQYKVSNYGELVCVIIPFFDRYQPRAQKKVNQYKQWRSDVLDRANFTIDKFK